MAQAKHVRVQRLAEAIALLEIVDAALRAVDLRAALPEVRDHVQSGRRAVRQSAEDLSRALDREDVIAIEINGATVSPTELVAPHLTSEDFVARAVRTLGTPRQHHVAVYTGALRRMRAQLLLEVTEQLVDENTEERDGAGGGVVT